MTTLPPPATTRIEVILFSGDRMAFGPYELARALLHRYVLIYYFLLGVFLTLVDTRSGLARNGVNDQAVIVAFSILGAVPFLVVFLLVLDFIAARLGRAIRIPTSPVLMAVAVVGVVSGDVMEFVLFGQKSSWSRSLVLTVFYYVLVEAIAHLVVLRVFPKVLRDLRGLDDDLGNRLAAAMPRPVGADEMVEIGGRKIAMGAITRIAAEGNYLRVFVGEKRMYLPGPFGKAVQNLPESLGVQVSRSDWVALRMVRAIRRDGRNMHLDLIDNTTIKVANARQKVVLSLLDLAGVTDQGADGAMSSQRG